MVGFLGECGGLVKRLFIWRKDLVELRGLFVMLLSLLELFVKLKKKNLVLYNVLYYYVISYLDLFLLSLC